MINPQIRSHLPTI